ncbi:MAG: hypothetical protein QG639_670 [Patescibacteria group bacterium]|nr:hypothetical protein [Patescibacteria group bacterium]
MQRSEIIRDNAFRNALNEKGITESVDLPEWLDIPDDEEFKELVEICFKYLSEDQLLDLLDIQDFDEALGLVFSFLNANSIDPETYLIMIGYISNIND